MHNLTDHPFAIHQACERAGLAECSWDRWIAKAEKIAGHDLDGNQCSGRDNYSLDSAYEAFERGLSPTAYVKSFQGIAKVEAA